MLDNHKDHDQRWLQVFQVGKYVSHYWGAIAHRFHRFNRRVNLSALLFELLGNATTARRLWALAMAKIHD